MLERVKFVDCTTCYQKFSDQKSLRRQIDFRNSRAIARKPLKLVDIFEDSEDVDAKNLTTTKNVTLTDLMKRKDTYTESLTF